MTWYGEERREHFCTQEANVADIQATIKSIDKRINGSIKQYDRHIEQGEKWRIAITGIVFAWIVQVVGFANLFGRQQEIVKYNAERYQSNLRLIEKNTDAIDRLVNMVVEHYEGGK